MKQYLRQQVIDEIYKFAKKNPEDLTNALIETTWNASVIEDLIKNQTPDNLRSDSAPIILVANWLVCGVYGIYKLEQMASGVAYIGGTNPANYYLEEAGTRLRRAFENKDIDPFFDWYDQEILRPLGFTGNEIAQIYEAIELCCNRLCQKIHGVTLKFFFQR